MNLHQVSRNLCHILLNGKISISLGIFKKKSWYFLDWVDKPRNENFTKNSWEF